MKDYIFDQHEEREENAVPHAEPKYTQRKNLLGISLLTLIIASAAVFAYTRESKSIAVQSSNLDDQVQIASTSPNAVLLTINGVPVTRKIYSLSINNILQLAESQKLDTNDKAVQEQVQNLALANVVNTELLSQKATADGYVVDPKQVEESITSITQKAGSKAKLEEGLTQLGMTLEELKIAIGKEVLATTYIGKVASVDLVTVTDAEIKKAYEAQIEKTPPEAKVPAYKDIKAQLKTELISQKHLQLVEEYLQNLRKLAKIEITK